MEIISVNVGMPQEVTWEGMKFTTSIFKFPVQGKVNVRKLNLDGDEQADLTAHGGKDKAVYGYPAEHYPYWRERLHLDDLPFGAFGENLTTVGLSEAELCIGDKLQVGSAILTVTQPRTPCFKLQYRFQRREMVADFLAGQRPGFYFSVDTEGELCSGCDVKVVHRDPNRVSILDIEWLYLDRNPPKDLLDRALRIEHLPESWKKALSQRASARHA